MPLWKLKRFRNYSRCSKVLPEVNELVKTVDEMEPKLQGIVQDLQAALPDINKALEYSIKIIKPATIIIQNVTTDLVKIIEDTELSETQKMKFILN